MNCMRRFVDIEEVYDALLGEAKFDGEEVFFSANALRIAVAKATTLKVFEPEQTNDNAQN